MALHFGNVIFCDYISRDENKKAFFIGVYAGHIVFSSFPAQMMLCIYLEMTTDEPEPTPHSLKLNIRLGEKEITTKEINLPPLPYGESANIVLTGVPLEAEGETTLTVSASVDGGEPFEVRSKKIIKGRVPSSEREPPV